MYAKKNHIIVRCDATPSIGVGHLMRCTVLAERFFERGWTCQFICSHETFDTCAHLFDDRFTFTHEQGDIPHCDLLIIDHYGLDQVYEKKCRAKAWSILVVDDLANRSHDCDFLLDQTKGRKETDYQSLVPDHCRLMLGAEFALLRKAFAKARPAARKRRQHRAGQIDEVLISLGGTNLHQFTEKVVDVFRDYSTKALQLNVVVGSSNSISYKLHQLSEDINQQGIHKIAVFSSVSNIERLMLQADLAIGACGTTSWERCCLGLPTVVIELAINQTNIAAQLHKRGAVFNLGWHDKIGKKEISDILDMFCDTPQHIIEMQNIAFGICDGQGVNRVTALIEEELSNG